MTEIDGCDTIHSCNPATAMHSMVNVVGMRKRWWRQAWLFLTILAVGAQVRANAVREVARRGTDGKVCVEQSYDSMVRPSGLSTLQTATAIGHADSSQPATLDARLPLPRAARASARARLWGRPRGRSGIEYTDDSLMKLTREDARVGAAKLWDGDELAAELDSESGPRGHVHYPGTFVPLLQIQNGEILVVVTDHLGMPRDLVDGDGTVRWSAAYTAWGKIHEEFVANQQSPRGPPTAVSSPFRLLGQYHDDETGLSATRFRMWDADTGRWLSPDPHGILGDKNLFALNGSPTSHVDRLGLSCENYHKAVAAQERAAELNASRDPWMKERGTTAVIRVRNKKTGEERLLVATEGTKLPREFEGKLKPNEKFIGGSGHAEEKILNSVKGTDWEPIAGGASRNVCIGKCKPQIEGAGMTLGGPVYSGKSDKTPYRLFWKEE